MTARNCLLLTVALLFATFYKIKAQEVSENTYDHKIIAILPLKTSSYKSGSTRKDSSLQQVIDKEEDWSLKAQQALYNAITQDKEKLLVEVQDWRLTNSLLAKAGIDVRKATFQDEQQLAAYLKVDAILSGELIATRTHSTYTQINNMTSGTHSSKNRKLSVRLYDGKTGDAIWSFERNVFQILFEKDKWMDQRLFDAFRRKFPYTR
jgi:hypothetical protein